MREKLLKTGMGCFVFASGVGVANTLLLPYARAHFGYPVWGTWAAYAAALLLFCLAGAPFPSWRMKKPRVLRA